MNGIQTLLLLVIAGAICVVAWVVYQNHQESEANKDEPIMCIVGASENC